MSRHGVLFLSSCTPSPAGTGWEQRAHRFISAYASVTDVTCWVKVANDDQALERAKEVAGLCEDVKVLMPDDILPSPQQAGFKRRFSSRVSRKNGA